MDTERYRTARKRIWAAIVDFIVFMPLLLIPRYVFNEGTNKYVLTVWPFFTTFASIGYTIFAHYKYGQTIGKWVAGVRVLDKSEERLLNLKQSFYRYSVDSILTIWSLVLTQIQGSNGSDEKFWMIDFGDIPSYLFYGWFLAKCITLLANEKRRAIHDILAKSVVVRTS